MKEAQEKITERLRQDLIDAPFLISYAEGISLSVYLVELGYHKLPEKPPLLTEEEAEKDLPITAGHKSVPFYMKAQRDSDIKHYEKIRCQK